MKRTAHDEEVRLSAEKLQKVEIIISKGLSKARTITRVRILNATHISNADPERVRTRSSVRLP